MTASTDESDTGETVLISGERNLLEVADLSSDMARLRKLFDVFDQKTSLLQLLDVSSHAAGVQIFIGGESNLVPIEEMSVVTAPYELQRERVLQRDGMSPERLDAILTHQMPDAEKRARADFVIDTSQGVEPVRRQVAEIIAIMRDPARRPKRDRAPA